jgi:hypothetical protein
MCSIYQNSTVTIVAASSQTVNEGFLEVRLDSSVYFPFGPLPYWCSDGEVGSIHF